MHAHHKSYPSTCKGQLKILQNLHKNFHLNTSKKQEITSVYVLVILNATWITTVAESGYCCCTPISELMHVHVFHPEKITGISSSKKSETLCVPRK